MSDISMNDPWEPPDPPADDDPVVTLDPRVDAEHVLGVLPCPNNPAPPRGWVYWKGEVPPGGGALASEMLHDSEQYPMGTFIQTRIAGVLVGARVEWHAEQGATGRVGCFRGVNLMRVAP